MSIKLYNGFKINLNIVELSDKLKNIQVNFNNIAQKNIAQSIITEAVYMYDSSMGEYDSRDFLSKSIKRKIKELRSTDNLCTDNWSFAIVLYPYNEYTLGIPFGHRLEKEWFKLSFVQPYGYWNSSDKPEEITSKEWSNRFHDWENAFGFGVPSETGFMRNLVNKFDINFVDRYKILNLLKKDECSVPSSSSRAEKIAKDKLFADKCGPDLSSGYDYIKLVRELDQYYETDAGKKELDDMICGIKRKIKDSERIRFELLNAKIR